ncbi:MAG: SMC-Scp complex subunit ScpB [Coriobacteriia bacterium]|nr:SMC-Scp complex subunit ScpB [Coriobacteriia bacterium]
MFQGLQPDQLEGAIEALLFVTDQPVSALTLAEMLETDTGSVLNALDALRSRLSDENRGIQLREVAGGWRLYTHPQFHELIERYVISWDTRKLSQAALETLAIVAYGQPMTRAGVAAIRGVNSDSSIASLVEKGLLREAGTADAPGNPTLYAVTRTFLEKFGLRSVDDLPPMADYAPDQETADLIRERLSATRVDVLEDAQPQLPLEGEIADGEDAVEASPLDAMEFTLEDDDESVAVLPDAARTIMSDALASALGTVEKINFDDLVFEGEDE